MLLSWALIYKYNFSPHRYYIWNNKDILYRNKSLFYPFWFTNNILLVHQLFNPDGSLMTYNEFILKYKIIIPINEFNIIMNAIPDGVIMLFKGTAQQNPTLLPLDPTKLKIGQICFSATRNSNRRIRSLFQKDIVSVPYVVTYWNTFIDNLNWKKIWNLPARYMINNKVKEVSFKRIIRFYPTRIFLQRFKKDIEMNCSFCEGHPEDMFHLFWSCPSSTKLWEDICNLICTCIEPCLTLCFEHILFGFTDYPSTKKKQFYIINLIIFLAKWHIHKCRYTSQKPLLSIFDNEVKQYIKTIRYSTNMKAIKTYDLCALFNVFV